MTKASGTVQEKAQGFVNYVLFLQVWKVVMKMKDPTVSLCQLSQF